MFGSFPSGTSLFHSVFLSLNRQTQWRLAPELDALENSTHPKGTRSPKGPPIGTPFRQVRVLIRLDQNGDRQYSVRHKAVGADRVEETDPPTNVGKIRLPPGTGRLSHGSVTHIDESEARNHLRGEEVGELYLLNRSAKN
jgi:hypothetical protein